MLDEQKFKDMAEQLRKPSGEGAVRTGDMMSKGNIAMIYDSFKVLDIAANDNILEIGMGNGFYVKDILEKNDTINYTGCDYAELMVQESERLNTHWIAAGRAKFIQANIHALPFDKDSFNKVFTINTIYFWDEEAAALNEIKRVLQPGGKLVISFRPKHQSEKYPFTKYGFNQFSKEDVEKLLLENGFLVDAIYENKEPPFEMNGIMMDTENVVVVGRKG